MKKHSIIRHAFVLWLFVLALAQPSFGQEETSAVTEVVPPTNATTLDISKEVSESNMPESNGDSPVLNTREVILLYAASIGGVFASVLSLLNWLAQRKAGRALANFFDANDFDVRHNNLIQQITDIDNDWKRTQKILNGEIQKLASQLPKDPATNAQIEKLNKVSIAIKQNLVEVKEIVDTMKSNQERASFQGQFDFPGGDGIATSEKGISPTGVSKNSRDQFVVENQRLETRNRELEESILPSELLIEELKNREIELKRRADSDREKSDRIISEQSDRYSSELREAGERIARLEKQLQSIEEGQKKNWLHSFNSQKDMKPLKDAIEGFSNKGNTAALLVVNSMHRCLVITDHAEIRELAKEVHVFGTYCYRLVKELYPQPIDAEKALKLFAQAVEEQFPSLKIRRAQMGLPKDQTWMNASAGNAPVQSVQGWAVLDSKGTALFRADVS